MAIKQTISLEGLQTVQSELKNLADVGESAFARIRSAVEGGGGGLEAVANNILNIGKALTSLTGALTVFTGITAGLIGLTVSASNAGEEFENLGHQLGTTTETASALIQSFARAGADIEGLSVGLRRAAANIAQEWAQIQQSVREAGLKSVANNLAVEQSLNNLAKAVVVEANQEKNAALQREANAQTVLDAQNRLDDLLEKQRLREGGVRDPQLEAERAAQREREEIAKARLQLAQAEQKAKEEQALAEQKAADAAIARETAELNRDKARQQRTEDQKNSVANLVGFVNDLAAGLTNTGRQVNATVDNIMKGIVASVGGVSDAIGNIDLSGVVPPEVFPVLLKLSDVLKNVESQTTRSALVTKFFGRSAGPELVAFLAQGGAAVDQYIKKVIELQLQFTTPMAHATQEFRRQLFTLESVLSAIKNQIGAVFAPVFGPFFEVLSNLLQQNRELFLSWANTLANAVKPILDSIIRVLSGETKPDDKWLLDIIESFKKFGTTIKDIVVPAIKSVIDVIGFIAQEINKIFGTNLDAVSGIFILFVTNILGGFKLIGIGLNLLTAAATAFAVRAGIAFGPLLIAISAIALAFLAILALVDKATFEGLKQLGSDLVDLGKKMAANFGKPVEDSTKGAEQNFDDLINRANALGESGKKAGTDIAQGQQAAQQSLQKTTQEAEKAKTGIDATFRAAPPPGVSGFDLLPKVEAAAPSAAISPAQQQIQTQTQATVQAFQSASEQIQQIWSQLPALLAAVDFSSIVNKNALVAPFSLAKDEIIAVFAAIAQEAANMADKIVAAAQKAADAIKQIKSGGGGFGGQGEGAPFAGGGRVIGPGSWTSDSILARLSRDEFVQPAMRVHQYGMDFMEAIRRGLLSTDAVRALMGDFRGLRFGGSAFPRFAEGGAVTSGSSRTLNLILGGQSFPLTGSAKVIDSLEREAALRSMASTGIAQSFVGRR